MGSATPPGGTGTMMVTGRDGYACAVATRENAGSATVVAARCRKFRRESFILNLPLASRHSITSSARKRTEGGMVRSRDFAVLRFIANSNFVGCSTGRSAGLTPLRTLATMIADCRQIAARLGP